MTAFKKRKPLKGKEPLHSCMMHETNLNNAVVVLVVVEKRKGPNILQIRFTIFTQRIDNNAGHTDVHNQKH